jgi:hypothetical protein
MADAASGVNPVVTHAIRRWFPHLPLLACVLVLLVSAVALARMDPIRVRAAWIVRVGQAPDFDWTPAAPPASFQIESARPTEEFVATAGQVARRGDLETAKAAALYIASFVDPKSSAVQRGVTETLRSMRESGLGFCSDVSQVFVGLTHALGLTAREWSVFYGQFGGSAHTFNEIFDRQRNKWVMVDAHSAFVPFHARSGEPLSFLELRDLVATGHEEEIRVEFLAETFFTDAAEVFDFYRPGLHRAGLTWANAEFAAEAGILHSLLSPLSIRLEQGARILAGDFPALVVLPTKLGVAESAALARTRARTLALAGLAGGALLLLPAAWRRSLQAPRRERDPWVGTVLRRNG